MKDTLVSWQSLAHLRGTRPRSMSSSNKSTTPPFLLYSLSGPGVRTESFQRVGSWEPEFLATSHFHYPDAQPRWALAVLCPLAWGRVSSRPLVGQQSLWELQQG